MTDQATQLRKLVQSTAGEFAARLGPAPRLVVVSSGQAGVGATTLAVNLTVSLAQLGQRTVLVDGDLEQPKVAEYCGVAARNSVIDVLTSRRDIHEVLELGPNGMHVVPGAGALESTQCLTDSALARLMSQMRSLGRHADIVLVDAGPGATPLGRRCWAAANQVVLVSTPATESLLDAYATLKVLTSGGATGPNVALILNQATDGPSATAAYERFESSCLRFLGREVTLLGWVPCEGRLMESESAAPLVRAAPMCGAARAIDRIAAGLLAVHAPQRRAA